MSDIDTLIELWEMPSGEDELSRDAKAELAQLRATIAQQAQRIAELETALDKAAEQIENGDIRIARDVLHAAYIKTQQVTP